MSSLRTPDVAPQFLPGGENGLSHSLRWPESQVAPAAAIADGGPVSSIAAQIRIRLSQYWPELAAGLAKRRLSRRKLPH